jgi:hypothetical protein
MDVTAARGTSDPDGQSVNRILQFFSMAALSMASRSPLIRAYSDASAPSPSMKNTAGQNSTTATPVRMASSVALLSTVPASCDARCDTRWPY